MNGYFSPLNDFDVATERHLLAAWEKHYQHCGIRYEVVGRSNRSRFVRLLVHIKDHLRELEKSGCEDITCLKWE